MSGPPNPAEIRDYLLRRLPEDRRSQIEEAYFRNDDLLDEVEAQEDQLVTEYVLGKLSESDQRRFESSLLGAPYYKERVETTTRLQQQLSKHPAFARRKEGLPTSQTGLSDPRIFPGRTGFFVGFALLSILLIASVISAWMLKREVADLKRQLKDTPKSSGSSTPGPASPEKR